MAVFRNASEPFLFLAVRRLLSLSMSVTFVFASLGCGRTHHVKEDKHHTWYTTMAERLNRFKLGACAAESVSKNCGSSSLETPFASLPLRPL